MIYYKLYTIYTVYVLVYCSSAWARNTSHNLGTIGEHSPSLCPQLKRNALYKPDPEELMLSSLKIDRGEVENCPVV